MSFCNHPYFATILILPPFLFATILICHHSYLPPFLFATILICHHSYLPPFLFATILICHHSYLPPFLFATILICHHSYLPPFLFATILICHHSYLPPFLFATILICHHSYLPPFLFATIPICHHSYLPPFLFATIPICHHSYLPPFLFATIPICHHSYLPPFLFATIPICHHSYLPPFLFATILGHLNINSVHIKIDSVRFIIGNNIDIFLISETKLNETFPEGQFLIDGFSPPYRKDLTDKGGGLYYSTAVIISLLNYWLLFCTSCPQKSKINTHMKILSISLLYLSDFYSEINDDAMKDFRVIYNFKSLITYPTCFKNAEIPSCIDLILTNKPMSFQNTSVIETGSSDFRSLTVTVMKMSFTKVLYYRNYKNLQ